MVAIPPRLRLAVAGLAAVVLLAGCSESGLTDPGAATVAASSAAATTDTLTALRLSMVSWWDGVSDHYMAITAATDKIALAATDDDITELGTGCNMLRHALLVIEFDPDSPDTATQTALTHATDDYATSADKCLAGDFEASSAAMDKGNTWVGRAAARIKDLTP